MLDPRLSHRPLSSTSSTTTADPTIVTAPLPSSSLTFGLSTPDLRPNYQSPHPHYGLSPSGPPSHPQSLSPSPVFSATRLPRTSSLLPPPHIAPLSNTGTHGTAVSRGLSPVAGQVNRPQTPPEPYFAFSTNTNTNTSSPSSATNTTHGGAYSDAEFPSSVNSWSASTGSSRLSIAGYQPSPISRFGFRNSSVDAIGLVSTSPQSSRPLPRKLQKGRRPSTSYHQYSSASAISTTVSETAQSSLQLPAIVPISPLEATTPSAEFHSREEGLEAYTQQTPPRPSHSLNQHIVMPFDHEAEGYRPNGHSRSHSGKGSSGSGKGRSSKPPSQKAMLSRALQKANTAVQLDNAQNFEGAREAYAEACNLLQQVLQRTSGDEDKRKLEAIRRTYTSRIHELDQIAPWQEEQDTKALPARPNSETIRPESMLLLADDDDDDEIGDDAIIETATLTKIVKDESVDSYIQDGGSHMNQGLQPPEHGLLKSSFSLSPRRIKSPDPLVLQESGEQSYMPAPLSPFRPRSPAKPATEDTNGGYQSGGYSDDYREMPSYFREEIQNSWLDPIDESGGSTASSVHSRTSSLGFRRRHIRAASGTTEAEFDTALDAAIEAAYDEGYEPMDSDGFDPADHNETGEDLMTTAMRKVQIARDHVRQTEIEAYGNPLDQGMPQSAASFDSRHLDFYDDDSSDEEERLLDELTRDYATGQPTIPRESDSSGNTSRTWHSSGGSNPATAATSLSTATGAAQDISKPSAPPPTHSLPDLPPNRPPSAAQSVRSRRLTGQNPKQLKIETAKVNEPLARPAMVQDADDQTAAQPRSVNALRRPSEPHLEASPTEPNHPASPFVHPGLAEMDLNISGKIASPTTSKLKKNFSSSSLRSKARNMSISNLDDNSDLSPGTPISNPFGSSRTPALPTLPTPLVGTFRDRMDPTGTVGLYLFDDNIHSPNVPGSPNPIAPDAPVPLEPCPTDFLLRPFWLMRCLYQTLAHPRGGYLSTKLFVPRDVWRVKGVKLKNIEDKVANCDFLTAALLKIAKVDTFDADAVLEEMQSLEGILEQVQAALTRKLGNEVGAPTSGVLFRDATGGGDGDGSEKVPRSASISGKSSSFSWRRLRSKNSAIGLGGSYNNKPAPVPEASKDTPTVPSLPMTATPTTRPAKRDLMQVQFAGPNAMYMSALARLFDAAQTIDQIARQVEDPGLRHADKTQVGLELCTRHAAEFFGFFICRFVLADLSLLLDKFIKRGSEWVLS